MNEMDRMTAAWRDTRRAVVRRLFLDRQARFWAQRLDGRWSLRELRARVVAVEQETPDTKTFVLQPTAGWQGYRAGQHTTVEVEIDGVRVRRCYSLSSAPGDKLLRITVKRAPEGRVSRWLHDHTQRGDWLHIAPAAGEFVLPDPLPPKLLLISGGSGITPLMSMLRDLDHRGAVGDLVFVHYARSHSDVIFHAALQALAARSSGLRLLLVLDDDPAGQGGFDELRLAARVPDFAARATFLCGPPGMMARLERMWDAAGASHRLRRERFAAPTIAVAPPAGDDGPRQVTVQLAASGKRLVVANEGTLLEQLERAGEAPRHGCRIGICHTCKCTKRTGTVQNLLTGAVSSTPDEEIQLCISVPRSDLELGL